MLLEDSTPFQEELEGLLVLIDFEFAFVNNVHLADKGFILN